MFFSLREDKGSGMNERVVFRQREELACRFNDGKPAAATRAPLDPLSRRARETWTTWLFSRHSLNLPQISSVVCKPADNARIPRIPCNFAGGKRGRVDGRRDRSWPSSTTLRSPSFLCFRTMIQNL